MDALIQFYRARLDEAEAVAKAAMGEAIFQRQTGTWIFEEVEHRPTGTTIPIIFAVADGGGKTQVANMEAAWEGNERATHIALHDPAAVLADIAAKRRIVANYERHTPGERGYGAARYAVLCLALPYAAHPDYDESWRP